MRISHVLVLLGVSAVLLALGGPAMLAGRERSRRTTCSHNLATIGLALRSYVDNQETLPPIAQGRGLGMWIPTEGGEQKTNPLATNWVILLMPQLGEEELQSTLTEKDSTQPGRFAIAFPRFRCPSDTFNSTDNLYLGSCSRGNYAIDAGSNDVCIQPGVRTRLCPNGAHLSRDRVTGERIWYGDGVAGYNKAFRLDEFPNGSSHMVAVEEVRAGIHEFDSRGVWSMGMVGSSATHQHGLYGDAGSPNNPWPNADDIYGCGRISELLGRERLVAEKMPCAQHIIRPRQATARSMHPGGVYCLMLDGSTRFVPDNVDLNVWHVMHSRENRQDFALPAEQG